MKKLVFLFFLFFVATVVFAQDCKYSLNSLNITRVVGGQVVPGCLLATSTCDTLLPFLGTKEEVFAQEIKNQGIVPEQYMLLSGSSEVLLLQHEKRPQEKYLFARSKKQEWFLVQVFKDGSAPDPKSYALCVKGLDFYFEKIE